MRPSGMLNGHPKDMDPSPVDPSLTSSEYSVMLSLGVASSAFLNSAIIL
jgi:hypothetical protein